MLMCYIILRNILKIKCFFLNAIKYQYWEKTTIINIDIYYFFPLKINIHEIVVLDTKRIIDLGFSIHFWIVILGTHFPELYIFQKEQKANTSLAKTKIIYSKMF